MSGDLSGVRIGQYEIREKVFDNTIIQTYRAFQGSLKRDVAIHTLSPDHQIEPIWREALVRGAELAASYEHPNIVPVLDYGVHEGLGYVVLRLMTGGTLLTRLQDGPLLIPETISIIRQIASALDHVHSHGGCHGDPATVNIIFDHSGNAYIADFYLMGFLTVTEQPFISGVRAFMAPERLRSHPPTPHTDQYALAGVAYNALTGSFPWQASDYIREPSALVNPRQHRPEIPTAVYDVFLRAFATDPAERFPTVMEFARQFEQALNRTPQHLFISYSRKDSAYAQRLKDHLRQNGLQVWIDDQIEHGDQWFNQINDAIKTCAAFLVIMSPDAEGSEWVQKEVLLAKRYQKPIFPLLLRGQEFPLLIDIQFADVRDDGLPGTDFHRRVSRAVYGE